MNKKKVLYIFLLSLLIFILSFQLIFAGTVKDAETCLKDKIKEKTCEKLSIDEQIFSVLSVSQCKDELLANSRENQCWPLTDCKTKTTAQAIFALSSPNEDAINWLLTQAKTPTELTWYLQIDTSQPSTCKITYDGQTKTVNIDDEKKLSSNVGSCLVRSYDDYWLEVEKNCYNKDISISCNNQFSTTLLYKKSTSDTIYVSQNTQSATTDGSITEKVNSLCMSRNNLCDYESTLWTAIALKSRNQDISAFVPYIVVMSDENSKYLPESFLYLLTGEISYYDSLLLKQKQDYWEESGNRYYDTAVALFSLQNDASSQKSSSLEWLLQTQDENGCWRASISETGFLLFAGWGKTSTIDIPSNNQTEIPPEERKPCSELGGEICDDGYECDSSETRAKEGWCCLGECKKIASSPIDDFPTRDDSENSYWYVWVLVILIILAIIGIIFRDKLRLWFFRLKSGFGKGSHTSTKPGPRFPPSSMNIPSRPTPRKLTPPHGHPAHSPSRREMPAMEKEFSDVLNKLKEISS